MSCRNIGMERIGVEVIGMRKGKVKQRLFMYTCTY